MRKTAKIILSFILICALSGCAFADMSKNAIKSLFSADTLQNQEEISDEETLGDNSITIGLIDVDTYNPLITTSPTVKSMLGFIFEPLFSIGSDMTINGVLATSYQVSANGREMTLNLKEGVRWHDGTLFDANDVVYTINTIKSSNGNYSQYVKDIESTIIINNTCLLINFKRPIPSPEYLFSFPIIKNKSADGDNFKLTGTGPFFCSNGNLSAFEDYHNGKAELDGVNILNLPDKEKFASLLRASVIDAAGSDVIDMMSFMPKSNSSVHDYVSGSMIYAGFNNESPVFRFPEARRGVSKLIDRKNIVTHIYFSRATASTIPCNPMSRFYNAAASSTKGDVSGAQKELTDKGWKTDKNGVYTLSDNVSLTSFNVNILVNSEDELRLKTAEEISNQMNKAGMKNTLIKCTQSQFASRISGGDYDMFIGETDLLPNNDLSDLLSSDGNILNYSDDITDVLLSQLGVLKTDEDIKTCWDELYKRIDENCPLATICFLKESIITSAKIKSGAEPSIEGMFRKTENWSIK